MNLCAQTNYKEHVERRQKYVYLYNIYLYIPIFSPYSLYSTKKKRNSRNKMAEMSEKKIFRMYGITYDLYVIMMEEDSGKNKFLIKKENTTNTASK